MNGGMMAYEEFAKNVKNSFDNVKKDMKIIEKKIERKLEKDLEKQLSKYNEE